MHVSMFVCVFSRSCIQAPKAVKKEFFHRALMGAVGMNRRTEEKHYENWAKSQLERIHNMSGSESPGSEAGFRNKDGRERGLCRSSRINQGRSPRQRDRGSRDRDRHRGGDRDRARSRSRSWSRSQDGCDRAGGRHVRGRQRDEEMEQCGAVHARLGERGGDSGDVQGMVWGRETEMGQEMGEAGRKRGQGQSGRMREEGDEDLCGGGRGDTGTGGDTGRDDDIGTGTRGPVRADNVDAGRRMLQADTDEEGVGELKQEWSEEMADKRNKSRKEGKRSKEGKKDKKDKKASKARRKQRKEGMKGKERKEGMSMEGKQRSREGKQSKEGMKKRRKSDDKHSKRGRDTGERRGKGRRKGFEAATTSSGSGSDESDASVVQALPSAFERNINSQRWQNDGYRRMLEEVFNVSVSVSVSVSVCVCLSVCLSVILSLPPTPPSSLSPSRSLSLAHELMGCW
jgi:hypothetical protein